MTTFLTNKAMPRRTFLQGLGATIAIPYLDAMVPAVRRFTPAAENFSHSPASRTRSSAASSAE